MKHKVLKDIGSIYTKGDVLNLTQGELDYGLRIGVDGLCPIVELIEGGYIDGLVEEKKQPKFIVREKVKLGNFYTTIRGSWDNEDGTFSYLVDVLNQTNSVQQEDNLKKPTDYELRTFY